MSLMPSTPPVPAVRVAVVDDEPRMRSALQDLVSQHPSLELVGAATTAAEAVSLAVSTCPDVMLLDVRLPGGGPDAARAVLAASPATAVVAISAFDDRHSIDTMRAAGAIAYLLKGRSTLLEIVSTIEWAAREPRGGEV